MKKIISLLLAIIMLMSITTFVSAEETQPSEKPVYKLTDVSTTGNKYTGKVELVSGQPIEGQYLFIRIVFFTEDAYFAYPLQVSSKGTFATGTNIDWIHLTIAVYGAEDYDSEEKTLYGTLSFDR